MFAHSFDCQHVTYMSFQLLQKCYDPAKSKEDLAQYFDNLLKADPLIHDRICLEKLLNDGGSYQCDMCRRDMPKRITFSCDFCQGFYCMVCAEAGASCEKSGVAYTFCCNPCMYQFIDEIKPNCRFYCIECKRYKSSRRKETLWCRECSGK